MVVPDPSWSKTRCAHDSLPILFYAQDGEGSGKPVFCFQSRIAVRKRGSDRRTFPRRMKPASGGFAISRFRQAQPLGDLPSPPCAFRGMLLTLESVLKRLAPRTDQLPGTTDRTTGLPAMHAFQRRACTAHTKVPKPQQHEGRHCSMLWYNRSGHRDKRVKMQWSRKKGHKVKSTSAHFS